MIVSNYDEAYSVMQVALQIEDDDPRAALRLWKAIARFDITYDHGLALWKVGECLQMLDEPQKAEIAYRAALSQEPDYDLYQLNYAAFLRQVGLPQPVHLEVPTEHALKDLLVTSELSEDELRGDLVVLAKQIVDWNCDVVATVRNMVAILAQLPEFDDDLFDLIHGFASETDIYPTGGLREKYDTEYRNRLDSSLADYLASSKSHLVKTCRGIVRRYEESQPLAEKRAGP